jgi:hypothetical protein
MPTDPYEPPNETALRNMQAVWCLLVLALVVAFLATGSWSLFAIGIVLLIVLAPYLGVKSD